MGRESGKSIARSLGEFFGHIWKGVRTDVTSRGGERQVLRHDVEEERRDTPRGKVTLRRTTIDEIETEEPGAWSDEREAGR